MQSAGKQGSLNEFGGHRQKASTLCCCEKALTWKTVHGGRGPGNCLPVG